jgi:hypothetical protein
MAFFGGTAGATVNQNDKVIKLLADPSVLEVKTSEGDKFSYRAFIGKNEKAYFLCIEKFARGKANEGLGQLIETSKIQDLPGGNKVKFDKGWYLTGLSWNVTGLKFKNQSASGSLITSIDCEVRVFDKAPSVICK